MTTINLNSEKAKAFQKLTTAQLKGKLKKADAEEKALIEAILNSKDAAIPAEKTETPKDAAIPAEKTETPKEEKSIEDEIAETEEAIAKAKASKNTNEVKKLTKKLEILKEDAAIPAAPKEEKKSKTPKAAKPQKEKKTAETAITSSKDKAVQERINNLNKLIGDDLKNELLDLKMEGIDVEFISFLNKGDEVEFEAANNSPHKGKKMKGIVVGISDLDSAGRKYCRVKVDKFKSTFQKAQMSVTRLDLPEVKPVKADKTPKAEAAPKADKTPKAEAAPKADKTPKAEKPATK